MRYYELDLSPRAIQHESGNCWTFMAPRQVTPGDDPTDEASSQLELYEDGALIGPPHSLHDDVRTKGGGRYSHWERTIYFSSTDNSSPLQSGKRYTLRSPYQLDANGEAPSRQRSKITCPCCGFDNHLRPYAHRLDYNGFPTDIDVCAYCTSLVNRSSLEDARDNPVQSLTMQEEGSRQVYSIDKTDAEIREQLNAHRGIIQALFNRLDTPVGQKTAVDIGAGLGFLSGAACDYFDDVWALEINRWSLEHMAGRMGLERKLHIGTDLDEAPSPVSMVMAWHALEHIPDLWKLGQAVKDKLEPGGVFYWQVPMYRDEYVVPSHYTFMNEHASAVFCDRIGLQLEQVWHDAEAQFITCIARKAA